MKVLKAVLDGYFPILGTYELLEGVVVVHFAVLGVSPHLIELQAIQGTKIRASTLFLFTFLNHWILEKRAG